MEQLQRGTGHCKNLHYVVAEHEQVLEITQPTLQLSRSYQRKALLHR